MLLFGQIALPISLSIVRAQEAYMHLSTPRLVPSVSRFEYKVEAANRIFRMVTPDDFSQFKLSEKNRTLLRALRNLCTPDLNGRVTCTRK